MDAGIARPAHRPALDGHGDADGRQRTATGRTALTRLGLKIIYTSGYSLDLTDPHFAAGREVRFLEKHYRSSQLLRLIRECLANHHSVAQAA